MMMRLRVLSVPWIGLVLAAWLFLAFAAQAQASPSSVGAGALEGWKDPPSLPGAPGYEIKDLRHMETDRVAFEGRDGKPIIVEGDFTRIQYRPATPTLSKVAVPTPQRIVLHYEKAVAGAGGEVLFKDMDSHQGTMTLKWTRDGRETWARIRIDDGGYVYEVVLVEKPAAFRVLIEREPCDAAGSGVYQAKTALIEGMPLLAWLGGEGNIDRVRVFPPRINTKLPLTEALVRERLTRSVCMDAQKDAWHYAPYTTGTIHLKDGTVVRFTMYLSGLAADSHLFGEIAP